MKDYISLSVNNLKRRRLRSWLTMIGIFIGIAAVVALISIGQGLQEAIEAQFQEIGSNRIIIEERGTQGPPGSGTSQQTKLTDKDLEVIKRVKGVESAAGILVKTAKVEFDDEINFVFIYGLPQNKEEKETVNFFDVEKGRDLKETDGNKAVIGIRHFEGEVFDKKLKIGDKLTIENKSFEVIGVLERIGNPFDDSAIIITKDMMRELYNTGKEEDIIHAKVDNVDNIDKIKEDIEKQLRRSRNEKENKETFQVTTAEQLLESFSAVFGIVQAVLVGIAAISLIVGGIGIANTMYTSVVERTKEIGTMKAIGAKNSDILVLFMAESGLLGLIGGAIGVIIGIGLSKIAEYYATVSLGTNLLQASTSPYIIGGTLIFAFVSFKIEASWCSEIWIRWKEEDSWK